jgi:hypothetical protein
VLTRQQEAAIDAQIQAAIQRATPTTKSEAERIFDTAIAFQSAAERCCEMKNPAPGILDAPIVVGIVNYAFAIELHLKSLLSAHSMLTKGHQLRTLFDQLPQISKTGIETAYHTTTLRTAAELATDLDAIANAFVDWRYLFEQNSAQLSMYRLIKIAKSMYIATRAEFPGWHVEQYLDAMIRAEPSNFAASIASFGGGQMMQVQL